jgi:DNA-binding response OmpR family regulator/ligand-binding sensor domain-containing protein/two-component sensor histidine kinase
MKRSTLFLILIVLSLFDAKSTTIRNLSIDEGLSNRRVFGAAIDQKGFMWFATKTGIDRYDGENFDHYRILNNESVRNVKESNSKEIYAFSERTLFIYNSASDNFEKVVWLGDIAGLKPEAVINGLYFDKKNQPYILTSSGILILKSGKWLPAENVNGASVYDMAESAANMHWVATSTGIYGLNTTQFPYKKTGIPELEVLKSFRVQSLCFDPSLQKLWIGTFAHGMFCYDVAVKKLVKLAYSITRPVKTIALINKSEIWVGIDGEGIYVFDRLSNQLLRIINQNDSDESGLRANGIYHIYPVNDNVWVSTYTAGVFVINTKSIVLQEFNHQRHNTNSLVDDHVNALLEDADGDLWFGTNKGLSFYSRKTGRWKHYFTNQTGDNKENSVILSLFADDANNIWVGGYATRFAKINKRSGSITYFTNLESTNKNEKSYIYSIVNDERGNLWLGDLNYNLKKIQSDNKVVSTYNIPGINRILNTNDKLYLATYRGLYVFDKYSNKQALIELHTLKGGEQLSDYPFVNNVVRDKINENILWLGTGGFGLVKFDIQKNEIEVITVKDGLSSDNVFGILYDNLGRMWISTENGLNCYNSDNKTINNYFEFDGLTDNTMNFLAYHKLKNGDMIFGSTSGAFILSPNAIVMEQNRQFNLKFKSFSLFYEKMKANSDNSPLKLSVDDTEEIELTYQQHSFSFDFIDLNIGKGYRTLYTWKLDGFDDEWSQPTTEHKAIYTNIPAGRYRFQVKAISSDGKSESEVRSISIRKHSPFWASTFAYLIYFGLLIWFVYFLIKFWLNKVDNKFTQDKIKFFVSMAHEIRTPITLIKAPLNEIDNENLTHDGRSALELARKNTDKLYGMVTQLLDFQKIEADAMKLCVEETHLNAFVDNVISNYIYLAKNKGIDLQKKSEIEGTITVWLDRNKVQIMIENLITNAIKYTEKNGYVNIFVELNDNKLQLQVSDNGIGIPSKAHSNLFKSFYRAQNAASSVEVGTGIGLMFTKRLVELHKGQISFISSENVGSTFRIEIPVAKADFTIEDIVEKKETNEIIDEHAEEDNQHAMHVLLVEDNDELRTYLSKMLRKKYSIAEAANGVEALSVLENDIPDLILSDVLMPEMDGFELCRRVKTNISTCHIPFILLTSLSDREDVMKGLELGADDYITKPFDSIILEGKIKAIFNNRALFRKKYIEKSVSINETNLLNDLNKTFMKKLVDQVESNITNEEFNIDELSSEMAMSRSVFFKKVKSLTGQNPKEFIRDIKMNKAADLLRDQKYSVSEIAYLIGFPNAKYFSTAFKKYYGMTPSMFVEKEKREDSFSEHKTDSED